jgi:DNA (cytosine-5)-methyltransferase 1
MPRDAKVPTKSFWHDFPTQPPVCNRNDGFPGRLAGITFPAWRNGSIHALGNAVVPQVVYEIFKIIEKIKI